METLSITEVCRRTGLSARALRFYEARGLVAAQRTAAGQRRYGMAEVARLHQLTVLKRAGFSLAQIAVLQGDRWLDLDRLIATQLASLAEQRRAIDDALAGLGAVQTALASGSPVDLDILCNLIKQGEKTMTDQTAWQKVYDRYYTPEEQAAWTALKKRAVGNLDMEKYASDWKKLTNRIEAALPLDPASTTAQAFLTEWQALQAPFMREAAPLLAAGTTNLYDHMDEWSGTVEPPFSKGVWDAIMAASAVAEDAAAKV